MLFNKADQIETDNRQALFAELELALLHINKTLDLSQFREYVQRVLEVRRSHRRKGDAQDAVPSLNDIAEMCFREQSLSPRQLPSEFQVS